MVINDDITWLYPGMLFQLQSRRSCYDSDDAHYLRVSDAGSIGIVIDVIESRSLEGRAVVMLDGTVCRVILYGVEILL